MNLGEKIGGVMIIGGLIGTFSFALGTVAASKSAYYYSSKGNQKEVKRILNEREMCEHRMLYSFLSSMGGLITFSFSNEIKRKKSKKYN